ncbi:MAG: hypothetical protein PWQ12_1384 [Clostridiales bacterium]|nr:hypothetical protein [Clostridiales bacterium]
MDMLSLLPPVLVLVGLLDVWVPKEVMMKYMGNGSGFRGIFFSLLLGFVAAGPLYISFPVATLLIKKGAALRYVVFFIGVWTTAKLPVFIYELTSFGYEFTAIHIIFGLTFYYFVGMAFEKIFAEKPIAIEE